MLAAEHLALGLLIAHAAWLWVFLCGSALRRSPIPVETPEEALIEVVLTSASGFAVTAFATYLLGWAGLLYPATAALAVVALGVVLVLRGASPLRAAFWRERLTLVRKAASRPATVAWMLAVFISLPALIPDTGSDATFYYLPLPLDWANAHRLTIDPWLRLPYTTNNWPLILTWPYVLHIEEYAQFVNWLISLLLLLIVYGFSAYGGRLLRGNGGMAGVHIAALLVTASLCTMPIFLHFVGANMIDVPSGMFFTVVAVAAIRAIISRDARHVLTLVVCGGFLIGLKISFIALLPLLGALIILSLRAAGRSRRTMAASLAALVILASPWYVEAFVLTGDPVPPVLNLRFQHKDIKWSNHDMEVQLADLVSNTSPRGLLSVPVTAFTDPTNPNLRDWGVSVMGTLYPLAAFVLAYALLGRRKRISVMILTSTVIVYGIAYWYLTSHLLRYALIFFPLVAALLTMLFAAATRRSVAVRLAAVPLMALLAIPSPASYSMLNDIWVTDYLQIGDQYRGRQDWLELRSPAYAEIEYLCRLMPSVPEPDNRVYVIYLSNSQLFFKECGLQMLGDAFGPERFFDLGRAVSHEDVTRWAHHMRVGAMLMPLETETFPLFAGLRGQLSALGWSERLFPQSDWVVYLAPSSARAIAAKTPRP
ncbi:MAG: hypothetical protein NVS4B13_01020 [Candidatus Elarobacter sp.]